MEINNIPFRKVQSADGELATSYRIELGDSQKTIGVTKYKSTKDVTYTLCCVKNKAKGMGLYQKSIQLIEQQYQIELFSVPVHESYWDCWDGDAEPSAYRCSFHLNGCELTLNCDGDGNHIFLDNKGGNNEAFADQLAVYLKYHLTEPTAERYREEKITPCSEQLEQETKGAKILYRYRGETLDEHDWVHEHTNTFFLTPEKSVIEESKTHTYDSHSVWHNTQFVYYQRISAEKMKLKMMLARDSNRAKNGIPVAWKADIFVRALQEEYREWGKDKNFQRDALLLVDGKLCLEILSRKIERTGNGRRETHSSRMLYALRTDDENLLTPDNVKEYQEEEPFLQDTCSCDGEQF